MSKRKLGRRKPSGDLRPTPPARDTGTPELIQQRLRASGNPDVEDHSPLDVLAARSLIAGHQARAGWLFAAARHRAFGKVPGSVDKLYARMVAKFDEGQAPTGEDDERQGRRERAYAAAVDVLKRMGGATLDVVYRVAVLGEFPAWTHRTAVSALHVAEIVQLTRGLDALAKHFGIEWQREAA